MIVIAAALSLVAATFLALAILTVGHADRLVRRNPPRLVFGKQLGGRSSPWLALIIDVSKLLSARVAHDETVGG